MERTERAGETATSMGKPERVRERERKSQWNEVRTALMFYDLQSKRNQSIHFMASLIRKLFHKSEAPKDGLTQPQREAMVDLLNYCMYADNLIFLAEDRLIAIRSRSSIGTRKYRSISSM